MASQRPKTILLQGEPGSGKSMMAGLTAVNKPVHFIDIDRKILSAGWAEQAIAKGEITVWELAEPFDDSNISSRIRALAKNPHEAGKGPSAPPQGWINAAEYWYKLPTLAEGKAAGTWVIDSLTLLNEHLKTFIMSIAGKSKYNFDQWNALKVGWMDTVSVWRDVAREHGKDLILTVHERIKEEPGDRTTGIKMEAVKSGDDVAMIKTFQGTQDVKVWASIDGSFGDLIGAHVDEYYQLFVEVTNGKPEWKCRVKPDGRRSLRTSFNLDREVYEPDFRKIWR